MPMGQTNVGGAEGRKAVAVELLCNCKMCPFLFCCFYFWRLAKARYIRHKIYFAIVVGRLPAVLVRWEVVGLDLSFGHG